MKEIWKDVVGWEGLYQVSNLGRVKSLSRLISGNRPAYVLREKILKLQNSSHGNLYGKYKHICMRKNGKTYIKEVHRLVAEAFIPNPQNLHQINHKDENPSNNVVNNLEWCDGFYNHNFGTIKTRTRETKKRNKSDKNGLLTKIKNNSSNAPKQVVQMDEKGNVIKVYFSSQEAGKELGISARNIRRCCNGEFSRCNGYIWKFKK